MWLNLIRWPIPTFGRTTATRRNCLDWSPTTAAAPPISTVSVYGAPLTVVQSHDSISLVVGVMVLPSLLLSVLWVCLSWLVCGASEGWPKYAHAIFYTTPDNGVAVGVFAPGSAVLPHGSTITLDTVYPYGDVINVTLHATAAMPLYIRVPQWATQATLSVNGGAAKAVGAGQMAQVRVCVCAHVCARVYVCLIVFCSECCCLTRAHRMCCGEHTGGCRGWHHLCPAVPQP